MNKYTNSASVTTKKGYEKIIFTIPIFSRAYKQCQSFNFFFHSVAPVFCSNLGYTGSCLFLIKEISFSASILFYEQQSEIVLNANS